MGEESSYKELSAGKSQRSIFSPAAGKRNGEGTLSNYADNRPSAIVQKQQINRIHSQPFSPFPEGPADREPMGLSAVRGNVLQSQATPFLERSTPMAVMQRQPFLKFAAAQGLKLAEENKAQEGFFKGNYNYYKKDLGKAEDRAAAFEKVATEGGKVGEAVDTILHTQLKLDNKYLLFSENKHTPVNISWDDPPEGLVKELTFARSKSQWNKITLNKGQIELSKLDPFVFTSQVKVHDEDDIKISYMFDRDHYSYVVKVEEGNIKQVMDEVYLKGDSPQNGYGYYKGEHEDKGNQKILAVTKFSPEAYTKLAGEGARFMCVRNNIENLTDNSIFYIGEEKKGFVSLYGIQFKKLWGTWMEYFNKKFNISDPEVGKVLMERGETVADPIKNQRDYDLSKQSPTGVHGGYAGYIPDGNPQEVD